MFACFAVALLTHNIELFMPFDACMPYDKGMHVGASCASPAIWSLNNEVSGIRQGTQSGNVACVHQGIHQAKQIAQSTCRHRIGLHSIVGILPPSKHMSVASNQSCSKAIRNHRQQHDVWTTNACIGM